MQESTDHKDEVVPDDLSIVLEFVQMLTGGGNVDEASPFAADHGWQPHGEFDTGQLVKLMASRRSCRNCRVYCFEKPDPGSERSRA